MELKDNKWRDLPPDWCTDYWICPNHQRVYSMTTEFNSKTVNLLWKQNTQYVTWYLLTTIDTNRVTIIINWPFSSFGSKTFDYEEHCRLTPSWYYYCIDQQTFCLVNREQQWSRNVYGMILQLAINKAGLQKWAIEVYLCLLKKKEGSSLCLIVHSLSFYNSEHYLLL